MPRETSAAPPRAFAASMPAGQPAAPPQAWFCGEMHNAVALAAELGLPATAANEALVLAGWDRWGERLWTRIDGTFAAAVRHGPRLWLFRDASGLHSLYLRTPATPEDATHFGTTLQEVAGQRPTLSRAAVHEFLRFGDISAPRTVFDGVHAVRAGWQLCWSLEGGVQWTQAPAPAAPQPANFDAAVAQLEALLTEALEARLSGARAPAAFLSGGIDSALLCALAAPAWPALRTLTVGFAEAELDESPVAARMAAHLKLPHEVMRFETGAFSAAFERLTGEADQPFADPAGVPTLLKLQACRGRFDAVIDGTGADEAVGMMPARHVRRAVSWFAPWPAAVRHPLAGALRTVPRLARYERMLNFEHPAELMMRWRGFTRAEVQVLCGGEPVSFDQTHFFRTYERFPRQAHFDRYSALVDAMPLDRLAQGMRIAGQAARFPFAAPGPDFFLRGLPQAMRWQEGQPKRILRAALARHVPPALWNVPKHGFDFPLQAFLRADGSALVRRHLAPEAWRRFDVLDPAEVQAVAQRFAQGDASVTFRVWLLVWLGAWLGHHHGRLG